MNTSNTSTILPIAGLNQRTIISARIWFGILGLILLTFLFVQDFGLFMSIFITCHLIAGLFAITFLESLLERTPPRAERWLSFTLLILGYISLMLIAVQKLKKYPM